MKKALLTDTIRAIKKSLGRYVSLIAITCLGVGFLVGVCGSSPIMATSMDQYNDENNLMDFTIYSSYGFDEDDIKAVEALENIDVVEGAYFVDVAGFIEENQKIVRIHGYNEHRQLNQILLVEGRLPENKYETVVEEPDDLDKGYHIGDVIELRRPEDDLDDFTDVTKLKVVGLIKTPYYTNLRKENSTLSNQTIDTYIYVLDDFFTCDYYLKLSATGKGLKELNSYYDAYEDASKVIKEEIEDLASTQANHRKDKILEEAQEKLDDAQKEYDDGLQEFNEKIADAEKEIADAKVEIADGWKQLREGEQKIIDGRAEIEENARKLEEGNVTGQIQINDARKQLKEAEELLAVKEAEFEAKKVELQGYLEQINGGISQIDSALPGLQQAQAGINQLLKGDETIAAASAIQPSIAQMYQLVAGFGKNPTNVNELSSALNDVETDINTILTGLSVVSDATPISMLGNPKLDALAASLNVTTVGELKTALGTLNTQVAASKAGLQQMVVPDATPVSMLPMFSALASQLSAQGYPAATMGDLRTSVPALISALEAQRASLVNNKAEIEKGLAEGAAQLAAGKQQIADGYQQTIDAAGKLEATIIDGRVQLEEARQELEDGVKELEENRQKLLDAEKELADGEEELEDKRVDGEKELNDAKKKIEEAREDLAELEEGEWTVLDRSQHYSSATYKGTVQQMKAIGDLFPVFFILVAGLVCLTTMTRMVDEERSQIGVVRALGYNALQSASKYLIYAMSAAFIGGILGTISGLFTYPYIIYTAWGMMYHIPPMVMDVPVKLILLANVGFIIVMGLVTYSACSSNMAEAVSQLLRPKPPKNGKKIILEYIPILWNNFSFTSKVTARNIFRYKKRFFMTVIGVAGCTALLVTGFGIKDSISSIVHLQFEEIKAYDTAITMEEDVDSATLKKFEKFLDNDAVERYVKVGNYTGKVIFEDKEEAASVEVFPCAEDVTKGNLLRDRSSGELITLNDEGIILDEKMALNLGVKLGDYVKLESENEILKEVKVIGLTENYINHYVYMTQKCYEDLYGFKKEYLTYFIKNVEANEAFDNAIAKQDGVKSISFFKGSIENFSSMIEGLDYIIIIITIAAGALAFVVLSNLTNVNISERQREIATLKVLGFNHQEVNSYIYRENLLLTFIGSLVGIPLGKLLHRFIILQVEMDYVMFGRNVALLSIVISIGITVGFAFIVNKVMTNKLKSIQMVESLKSVE